MHHVAAAGPSERGRRGTPRIEQPTREAKRAQWQVEKAEANVTQ